MPPVQPEQVPIPPVVPDFEKRHTRLKKLDIVIIVVMGLLLSASSFFVFVISEDSVFNDISQHNLWLRSSNIVLSLPAVPMVYLFHYAGIDNGGGDDLASYLWGVFSAPVVSLVIWIVIFYLLAKISAFFLRGRYGFLKHAVSILILVLILFPYLYYFFGPKAGSSVFGVNKNSVVDSCLSGALNIQMMSPSITTPSGGMTTPQMTTLGPEYCLGNILDPLTRTGESPSKDSINFCLSLSPDKIVQGTQQSYRDYCIYALGVRLYPVNNSFADDFQKVYLSDLPTLNYSQEVSMNPKDKSFVESTYQSKLCEIYGLSTNSLNNKNQCLVYFLNWYRSGDNKSAVIDNYCKNINLQPLPSQCTQIPPQLDVKVEVNGSHNPAPVKINSPILVSWKVSGYAEYCDVSGSFSPRADGKGKWGQGANLYVSTTSGSMMLIADKAPILGYEVFCTPNADRPVFNSARDNVTVQVSY